jgi:hypothetical protein
MSPEITISQARSQRQIDTIGKTIAALAKRNQPILLDRLPRRCRDR